jgi:hypothetical protein
MRILAIACLMLCGSAQAQMYARVDKLTGHTTYTNLPPRDVEPEQSDIPVFVRPIRRAAKPYLPSKPHKADLALSAQPITPADFPKVSESKQKERDDDRRHILMTELRKESVSLEEVELKKADAETINRHKTNIAALKREIQNIK